MNLDTINIVMRYYQALWVYFDPETLDCIFTENITTFHTRRNEKCDGIEKVLESYQKNFFSTVDLDSTKIYDFHIQKGLGIVQPHTKGDVEQVVVSYTLEQTHSNRGKTFGHVTETFELRNGFIIHITMNSQFLEQA